MASLSALTERWWSGVWHYDDADLNGSWELVFDVMSLFGSFMILLEISFIFWPNVSEGVCHDLLSLFVSEWFNLIYIFFVSLI